MKKLYFIANARIPTQRAHGLQVVKMCEAFARVGFDVELIIPRRFNELPDDPFTYYNVEHNFTIKKLFTIDWAPHREPAHPLFYWLQSITFGLATFLYMLSKKDAYIYFRFDTMLAPLIFLFQRRNVTVEAHFLLTGWQRRVLLAAKNIVVANRAAKNVYDDALDFEEKVFVASDGVSVSDFTNNISQGEARKKLSLPLDKKLVLYTGYFYPWKGIETLVRAAPFFSDDTEIVMVGGSEEDTAPLLKLKEELGISNVRFVGFRPYHEMAWYQKAADCLVITASAKYPESNLFTSPLKLFEYMLSGQPIVASRSLALAEILDDGKNALLVTPDDPQALADGIKKVLEDQNLARRLAAVARHDGERYDWNIRAKNIKDFIIVRAHMPRVLYLFAGERRWMVDAWRRKRMADSQLIGINHLFSHGISARFLETRWMNVSRKINFNLAQLPALVRIRNYDILFLNSNLLFVFLLKQILRYKKPRIVFYNTFFMNTLKRNVHGFYAWLIRRAIASIDMVVCPSTAQKEFLIAQGFDSSRITTVLNGVDETFFTPSKKESHTQKFSILSVGKDMGRDYRTLIEAVRGSDISTTIIAAPRNLKDIADVPENVKILFDVPQEKIRDYYTTANLVVVPTFSENHWDASDCSGQYVILESMAAGKAVITSERSTLSGYIQNKKNGLLVKGEDPVALQSVIETYMKNKIFLETVEKEARKTIENFCTTKKLANALSGIFHQLYE